MAKRFLVKRDTLRNSEMFTACNENTLQKKVSFVFKAFLDGSVCPLVAYSPLRDLNEIVILVDSFRSFCQGHRSKYKYFIVKNALEIQNTLNWSQTSLMTSTKTLLTQTF